MRPMPIRLSSVEAFLDWAKKKISLHHREDGLYFYEREVWWVSLGQNVGSEENGKHQRFERPVLIYKKLSRDLFFGIPLTTKTKEGTWYHSFLFEGQARTAILAQMRVLSGKRLIRKMGNITPEVFVEVEKALLGLIKTDPPVETRGSSEPIARPM